jgi:hypothetical protein
MLNIDKSFYEYHDNVGNLTFSGSLPNVNCVSGDSFGNIYSILYHDESKTLCAIINKLLNIFKLLYITNLCEINICDVSDDIFNGISNINQYKIVNNEYIRIFTATKGLILASVKSRDHDIKNSKMIDKFMTGNAKIPSLNGNILLLGSNYFDLRILSKAKRPHYMENKTTIILNSHNIMKIAVRNSKDVLFITQ